MTTQSQRDARDAQGADDTGATRRRVLAGVGLVGLAGTVSACSLGGSASSSGGSGGSGGSGDHGTGGGGAQAASGAGGSGSGSGGSAGGGSGGALGTTSEIPVGGGKVFSAQQVVVTQPESGTYKGFSAICTHMQCTVDQVANGTIDCPCHGSQFSVKDGSVVAGPAPSPLPSAKIKVSGTKITLG